MEPAGFITDPAKIFEFPFMIMDSTFKFVMLIMQQSFEFATSIGRLVVGA